MSDERKPLALLIEENEGGKPGDGPPVEGPEDVEMETAKEAASMLGAKDPGASAPVLVDLIRQCIASSKAGKY